MAASLFSNNQKEIDTFLRLAKAGCVNINAGTAGASSKLPFGGLGISGNHHPAGSFALDYCAYPVASMIETGNAIRAAEGVFVSDWIQPIGGKDTVSGTPPGDAASKSEEVNA